MSQYWRGPPRGHVPYGGYLRPRVTEQHLTVLAAEEPGIVNPCECTGLLHEHDPRVCPVTAVATEWEQTKEARRTERAGAEHVLKHQQMRKFKREIRDVILTLVNEHGVEYRMQADGQHIFLYSGARGERPFKVAAMRPVAKQMGFLVPWVREHFPHIDLSSGKKKEAEVELLFQCQQGCVDVAFATVEEINEHYSSEHYPMEDVSGEPFLCRGCGRPELDCSKDPCKDVIADREATVDEIEVTDEEEPEMEVPKPTEVFPPKEPDAFVKSQQAAEQRKIIVEEMEADGFERYRYPTAGPSEFFMVKGDYLKCIADGCEYEREGSFAGVHLHEYTHTDKHEEMLRTGAETRKVNAAIKVERAFESVSFLAQQYGFVVMTKEEADRFKSTGKTLRDLEAAQAEIARLQSVVDEQEAKIALAREAFGL